MLFFLFVFELGNNSVIDYKLESYKTIRIKNSPFCPHLSVTFSIGSTATNSTLNVHCVSAGYCDILFLMDTH